MRPERVDDRTRDPAGQRAGEAEPERALLAGADGDREGGGAVGAREQVSGLVDQSRPGGRQRDATSVALEQLHAQRGFECPNLLAHARLGETQSLGRAAEVKFLGNRHERPQLSELHER